MTKKSLKYLAVAATNIIILTMLLILWTDELELTFNDFVRPKEFLKIMAFGLASLIAMRIMVGYYRRTNSNRSKIQIAILLTFLISSYLYVTYSEKIVDNIFINGKFRQQIVNKIEPSHEMAMGTKAENLTSREYQQITKMYWFPKLADEAFNIQYTYGYDGFLPDYIFTLKYDLPAKMKVDTMSFRKGDFSKYQSFVTVGNIKRVTYSENLR